ncbi:hypothetical protein HY621_02865 [Candidatus Uhrbacteria bacterium]|nr:hypothetical protein [Candidatus Uhrbacteria bacterium]
MAIVSQKIAEHDEPVENSRDRKKTKKHQGGDEKTTLFLEWVYGILLFGIPFFFLGVTDDLFDLNKQTLLFAGTLIASIVYGVHIVSTQSVRIRGSFLTLTLLLLAIVWCVASFLSLYPYVSFVGLEGHASTSFATLGSLIILIIISTNVFTEKHVVHLVRVLIGTTTLLSVSGLLQIFGVFILPGEITKTGLMYPGGLINGVGLNAALGLVLAIAEIVRLAMKGRHALSVLQILLSLFTGLQLITLIVFDDWALWTSVAASLGFMLLFLYVKASDERKISWLVLPSFALVFSLTMLAVDVPKVVAPLQAPQLSLSTSFAITLKALQERPLFGYGPGNFGVAYTQFRPNKISVWPKELDNENIGKIWAERFLQSGSQLMTKVVGVGLIGFGALILLFVTLAFKAIRWLVQKKDGDDYALYLGVVGSMITLGVLGAIKPIDFSFTFFLWMLIGFFSILSARSLVLIKGQHSNRFVILSSLVLFTIISISLVGVMFASVRYAADVTFRSATSKDRALSVKIQAGEQVSEQELNDLLSTLERAVKMDPYNHRYPKALAQALVYKTSSLATNTNGGQENIVSVRALATNAATLSQQVVALNPRDARNMQNFADTLQAVFPFVENGYGLTQQAYAETLKLDPQNPSVHTAFAKFYLSAYLILVRQQESLEKKEEKNQAKEEASKALAETERLLREAIALKADYPEAYFHLGTLFAMQDNKKEAIKNFDTALEYNFRLIPLRAADEVLFYNLGLNFEALKQQDKAQTAYKLASSIQPKYYVALWRSALLDKEQGNDEASIATLKKILDYDPQNKTVQDKIKEFENKSGSHAEETE